MEILKEDETLSYVGGAKLSLGLIALIGAGISFVLGIINGASNPGICKAK